MLAAIERILADDMDVLNMSIGDCVQQVAAVARPPRRRTASSGRASSSSPRSATAAPAGLYAAGAPGVGEEVIGVASFENSHVALTTFTVSPGGESIGYAQRGRCAARPDVGQPAAGPDRHADDRR